jgi:hypothetical protein
VDGEKVDGETGEEVRLGDVLKEVERGGEKGVEIGVLLSRFKKKKTKRRSTCK